MQQQLNVACCLQLTTTATASSEKGKTERWTGGQTDGLSIILNWLCKFVASQKVISDHCKLTMGQFSHSAMKNQKPGL